MATYNGAKHLREQLDSFAEQSHPPDELIVSDDASHDDTLKIVDEFARSSPFFVRVLRNETTLGYAANFERAIKSCNGDIIFLSDQDDKWLSNKIDTIIRVFDANRHTCLVVANMILADEDLNPSPHTQLGNILAVGENSDRFGTGCGMAFRQSLLAVALPFPVHLFKHDSWLNDIAIALDVRQLIAEPLQLYRRHGKNASNWLLSRTDGVGQVDLLLASGLSSAAQGWAERVSRYRFTRARLVERFLDLKQIGLVDHYQAALSRLDSRTANLENRLRFVERPRRERWQHIVEFWRSGGYADFAGWKSALKDLIRP
jgi:glycosyltransferase involved in cell wall biosynthesis